MPILFDGLRIHAENIYNSSNCFLKLAYFIQNLFRISNKSFRSKFEDCQVRWVQRQDNDYYRFRNQ